jgi:hypothetical protein
MKQLTHNEIHEVVRNHYGKTAEGCCGGPLPEDANACCVADAEAKAAGEGSCGCNSAPSQNEKSIDGSCCSGSAISPDAISKVLGYSADELSSLAVCGLGGTKERS